MLRFFDFLNRPIVVLIVLVVVVGINVFLYFFVHRPLEAPTTSTADRGGPQTTVERTERRAGPGEATRSVSTLRSATSPQPSATASATPSP